jgi:Holliday junction resolvase RusA-like endonuclease
VIDFFMACVPPSTSHHAKRIVRRGRFTSLADKPELVAAKGTLDALLLPYQPSSPMGGPLSVTLTYTWPWRASESRRTRALGRVPRTTKPDCDNLAKTTIDRLARLRFIDNDAMVARLTVAKYWGEQAGIAVKVERI